MKFITVLFVCLVFGCQEKKTVEEVPVVEAPVVVERESVSDKMLINPGISIGQTKVGQRADSLQTQLGVPDLSDSAMGKAWLTWYSNPSDSITGKYELNIFTKYKDRELKEKIVSQIRVTSPEFKTAEGISTGIGFDEIRAIYHNIQSVGNFINPATKNVVSIFDVAQAGVAFEVEDNFCTAIIIYRKTENLLDDYQTFRPDLKP